MLFPSVGSLGATAFRLALSAIVLGAIFKPWRVKIAPQYRIPILVYGLVLGCMNSSFYVALETLPLGLAVALEFIGPLTVAIITSRKPMDFLWVGLAFLGVFLILPIGSAATVDSLDPRGVFFALLAGLCWGAYIIVGNKASKAANAGVVTAFGVTIGSFIAVPLGLFYAGNALFQVSLLPLALGVALLSSVIPYSLEMSAMRKLPAKTFSILMCLEPAFGALSGLIILNEQLTRMQWVAIGCIVMASVGSAATSKQAKH